MEASGATVTASVVVPLAAKGWPKAEMAPNPTSRTEAIASRPDVRVRFMIVPFRCC
jgi:hypothetical protein